MDRDNMNTESEIAKMQAKINGLIEIMLQQQEKIADMEIEKRELITIMNRRGIYITGVTHD